MAKSKEFEILKDRIAEYCNARDWSQFHDPKNIAISLQLEAAEILELFQWTKDNEIKPGKEAELADELADVFYWTIKLATHYDIDLFAAANAKMDKNELKYPVEKAKGTAAKYTEL
jgi:dCTP diphosphatase